MPQAPAATSILSVPVHMTTLDSALAVAETMIRTARRGYFCHASAHSILEARADATAHAAFAGATLVCPDGMPLVWIGRRRGHEVGRTYGPDFMTALITRTAAWRDRPCRHFFFGSSRTVLEQLASRFLRQVPGIELAGMLSPPFGAWDDALEAEHRRIMNDSGADVVWVSLGAPRQELWMHRNRPYLAAPLLSGVGAAFDFLSGAKPQAPVLLQRAGLEWAFRLMTEPGRLGGRYVRTVPRFAALALMEELSRLVHRRRHDRWGGEDLADRGDRRIDGNGIEAVRPLVKAGLEAGPAGHDLSRQDVMPHTSRTEQARRGRSEHGGYPTADGRGHVHDPAIDAEDAINNR